MKVNKEKCTKNDCKYYAKSHIDTSSEMKYDEQERKFAQIQENE